MTADFFLYAHSNDLAAARHFYTDLLGLNQIWDEADSIAYTVSPSVQLSIDHDAGAPAPQEWSFQPGWVYGLGVGRQPILEYQSTAASNSAAAAASSRMRSITGRERRDSP